MFLERIPFGLSGDVSVFILKLREDVKRDGRCFHEASRADRLQDRYYQECHKMFAVQPRHSFTCVLEGVLLLALLTLLFFANRFYFNTTATDMQVTLGKRHLDTMSAELLDNDEVEGADQQAFLLDERSAPDP